MLSYQTCTNQTGSHRRQQSTPAFQVSNRPLSPESYPGQVPYGYGFSFGDHSPTNAKAPSDRPETLNVESVYRQQDHQQHLQATQQTISRPGYLPSPDNSQPSRQSQNLPSAHSQGLDHGYLSTEAINALLMDLQHDVPNMDRGGSRNELNCSHSIEPSQHAQVTSTGKLVAEPYTGDIDDTMRDVTDVRTSLSPLDGRTIKRRQHMSLDLSNSQFITDMECLHRPQTPAGQQTLGPLPKTPMTAPVTHRQHGRLESGQTFPEASPIKSDPEKTIKASHPMQRVQSCQDSFSMMRENAQDSTTTQKTAHVMRRSVDLAFMPSPKLPNMNNLRLDMPASGDGYIPAFYPHALSSTMSSYQSSPETPTLSLFESQQLDDTVLNATDAWVQTIHKHGITQSGQSSPMHGSPHQRAQSVTDTDLDECVVSTGVTADDIAAFIQGPFPDDSKWRCLYKEKDGEECGKRFARKENAKSHVQTHLGDRQFVCKVCRTRFVRQHDLKRHFKIHTEEKPHVCPCGKTFHRHDALTRHRQRGMCVGAFENSPKKSVKRGRPKKPRPSSEERAVKAAQTRQRIMAKTYPGSTYASSISGSSDDSHCSPPNFDSLSVPASSPSLSHKELQEISSSHSSHQPLTPPTSPTRSPYKSYSSPYSQHSQTPKPASRSPSPNINSIPEETQHFSIDSFGLSNDGYQNSPPELELSSSSPATSHFNFVNRSDVPHTSLSGHQPMGPFDPQILDADFQLYDGESKESPGSEFDTFFDFSEYHSPSPEKADQKRLGDEPMPGPDFFGSGLVNESDDPFVDL